MSYSTVVDVIELLAGLAVQYNSAVVPSGD